MIQYRLFTRMATGIALLVVSTGINAQERFTITGQLAADSNGVVRLSYFKGRNQVIDSTQVTAGRFSFTGTVDAPCEATLVRNPASGRITYEQYIQQDDQEFYLAPGTNIVSSNTGIKKAQISNNGSQADFLVLKRIRSGFDSMDIVLQEKGMRAFEAKDDTALNDIKARLKQLEYKKQAAEDLFMREHPDSYVALDILQLHIIMRPVKVETDIPLFNQFSERIRLSPKGKALNAVLQKAQSLTAGHPAPDFTLLDTTGMPVSLSSFRGKYVLLCFWSIQSMQTGVFASAIQSFCKEWNREDLRIVSVGYVPEWDMWLGALQRLRVPGIHLIDLNGIDTKGNLSETASAYGLSMGSFPQCFLLDKNGNILARHLAFDNALPANVQKLIP